MTRTKSLSRKLLALAATATLTLGASSAFAQGKGETIRVQDYPGGGNTLVRVAIARDPRQALPRMKSCTSSRESPSNPSRRFGLLGKLISQRNFETRYVVSDSPTSVIASFRLVD